MEAKKYRVMEICGTHTHALMRYGLKELYSERLELVCGPGCPVCVTSQSDIDRILYLCDLGMRIYTFGDLMKVPGKNGNLRERKALGACVREVYNPLWIVDDMKKDPARGAVFVAIGFETTAPLIASLIEEIERERIENLYVYLLLKLIPPAMEALLEDEENKLDGFICPGHVSTIIGERPYIKLAEKVKKPFVIAGFTREELTVALEKMSEMLEKSAYGVVNVYASAVKPEGNLDAREKIKNFFEVTDTLWRGLGTIPNSGLKLREKYRRFDVMAHFQMENVSSEDPCPCGEVLTGKIKPEECQLFGTLCLPETPVGPCMVSSEGACHASFLYGRKGE
ncbi:hydrogenase formation HypD protein [Kosmotoga olearia TBF 19.5.1]|uniref:Hydrogenase formation HypD protein n=1 Tax=Kosmotoga olearia (strain ATCC BAA-1733 / DSM 21960 / TBF 19.5.1) TaxID=521045 RepID=C5CEU3_KOSOT|nr:hydrogenase formation HypD protein [Kosmotoga olearia TBF 19.5.1]